MWRAKRHSCHSKLQRLLKSHIHTRFCFIYLNLLIIILLPMFINIAVVDILAFIQIESQLQVTLQICTTSPLQHNNVTMMSLSIKELLLFFAPCTLFSSQHRPFMSLPVRQREVILEKTIDGAAIWAKSGVDLCSELFWVNACS